MNSAEIPQIHRTFRLQYEPAQEAHVLLYPEGMVKLSDSAAEILKLCDGERSAAAIVGELQSLFPGADLEADVHAFLDQAREQGWLVVSDDE